MSVIRAGDYYHPEDKKALEGLKQIPGFTTQQDFGTVVQRAEESVNISVSGQRLPAGSRFCSACGAGLEQ